MRKGRYYVMRRGEWIEALVIEADSPGEAEQVARTIPDEDWHATRKHYGQSDKKGRDRLLLGNVSVSDETPAWNAPHIEQED